MVLQNASCNSRSDSTMPAPAFFRKVLRLLGFTKQNVQWWQVRVPFNKRWTLANLSKCVRI